MATCVNISISIFFNISISQYPPVSISKYLNISTFQHVSISQYLNTHGPQFATCCALASLLSLDQSQELHPGIDGWRICIYNLLFFFFKQTTLQGGKCNTHSWLLLYLKESQISYFCKRIEFHNHPVRYILSKICMHIWNRLHYICICIFVTLYIWALLCNISFPQPYSVNLWCHGDSAHRYNILLLLLLVQQQKRKMLKIMTLAIIYK